jgi:hypothetical protein
MYRELDETSIITTLHTLHQRIDERFPGSGLSRVAGELGAIARETEATVDYLRRPLWWARLLAGVFVLLVLVLLVLALVVMLRGFTGSSSLGEGLSERLQGIEALVNDFVFLGIAIWFVFTIESRIKRRRALRAIHELRSIAHIVDMHQLTKDPERLLSGQPDTASSPVRNMTHDQLGRYLDYCAELLSHTSKLAALYVQNFNDPVVLETVSEVEHLASGLSGKIWQKIGTLHIHVSQPAQSAEVRE